MSNTSTTPHSEAAVLQEIQQLEQENQRLVQTLLNVQNLMKMLETENSSATDAQQPTSTSLSSPKDQNHSTQFIPPNTHLFLQHTFLYATNTIITSIRKVSDANELKAVGVKLGESDALYAITLQDNIFSPQKGGQPSDVGQIQTEEGLRVNVLKVLQNDDSVPPQIYVSLTEGSTIPTASTPVAARVDKDARQLHARLHSAGHLLDLAVKQSGMTQWTGGKGYHFPLGPYVEYNMNGQSFGDDKDAFLGSLQRHLDELTTQDGQVQVEYLTPEQVQARLGEVPSWFKGDHLRIVSYGDASCPCSGTHVEQFSQIGRVVVKKAKKKKDCFRISYEVKDGGR